MVSSSKLQSRLSLELTASFCWLSGLYDSQSLLYCGLSEDSEQPHVLFVKISTIVRYGQPAEEGWGGEELMLQHIESGDTRPTSCRQRPQR